MPALSGLFPKDKKITFVGLGVSNTPVAELLLSQGYDITLRDKKLTDPLPGFRCIFGEDYLKNITEDIIFLAPALRPDINEIVAASQNGAYVTTELNEFFKRKKGAVIAVTGSDGKTTTTSLIYEILKNAGVKTLLGGNIGSNLLTRLDETDPQTVTVCEISSFQLTKTTFSPDVAVITNISPNHLDWHTGMDEYINAKRRVFQFMKSGFCVLNIDDKTLDGFISKGEVPVRVVTVSGDRGKNPDVFFDKGGVFAFGEKIIDDNELILPGIHNRYNFCEAVAATYHLASKAAAEKTARTFPGVKHRMEFVREVGGVRYYNSSMDSSPTRTAAALGAFEKKVLVIAGGYDKLIPLETLAEVFENHVSMAVLIGDTGPKIKAILEKAEYSGIIKTARGLEEAVQILHNDASPGDIAVLSPAAASFDMFKDFKERGEAFIKYVNAL